MGIVEDMINERSACLEKGLPVVSDSFNGVDKEKIMLVLKTIDRCTNNMVEAVFALLDDRPSFFTKAAKAGLSYRDGATTAHIGSHIGILQRGRPTKLDREGRDSWLKPLWEIGAIEKVYFDSPTSKILSGHPKAKSPNSAYRLAQSFVSILESQDGEWQSLLNDWINKDVLRERLSLQADQAEVTRNIVDSAHSILIKASSEVYCQRFLQGYQIVYIDDGDGDRVTENQKKSLANAGLTIELNDSMPDILLWNPTKNSLWVIEAVTSDGEVDIHKKNSLQEYAHKHKKSEVGFTTTYPTWKKLAERQSQNKNLAEGTYLWIQEDPSRNLLINQ